MWILEKGNQEKKTNLLQTLFSWTADYGEFIWV